MTELAAPPTSDSVIETDESEPTRRNPFFMAKAWIIWIVQSLLPRIASSPEVLVVNQEYTDQHVSFGTTSLPTGPLSAGVYEVWYYARVTTADGVASSLQVGLGFTESGGPSLSLNGAVMNADSTILPQTGAIRVTAAANSTLTFTTTYSSNTANKMRYKLQFSVMRLGSL